MPYGSTEEDVVRSGSRLVREVGGSRTRLGLLCRQPPAHRRASIIRPSPDFLTRQFFGTQPESPGDALKNNEPLVHCPALS